MGSSSSALPFNKFILNFFTQACSFACQRDSLKLRSIKMELLISSSSNKSYVSQQYCHPQSDRSPKQAHPSLVPNVWLAADPRSYRAHGPWEILLSLKQWMGQSPQRRRESWESCTVFDLRWDVPFYDKSRKKGEDKDTCKCIIVPLERWQSFW